jgi:hypothetical protein
MTIAVNPTTGRFTADAETIERLKALCAQDAAMLASGDGRPTSDDRPLNAPRSPAVRPPRRPWRPEGDGQPVATDDDIEAELRLLMATVSSEARRSFQLAHEHTQPGQLVELRDIHIGQAARLTRAYCELVEALAGRRGIVVEHRHQHLHRRVPRGGCDVQEPAERR